MDYFIVCNKCKSRVKIKESDVNKLLNNECFTDGDKLICVNSCYKNNNNCCYKDEENKCNDDCSKKHCKLCCKCNK